MTRTIFVVTGLLPLALFAACSGGSATASAPTPEPAPVATAPAPAAEAAPATETDEASTLDGVYTVAQAERGLEVYQSVCTECHDGVEDWTDEGFLGRWDGDSVYRFWHYIYERMPHGDPYTLTREQVSDVLTYILQLNGLPAGAQELGTDDDSLDDYWLYWTPRQ